MSESKSIVRTKSFDLAVRIVGFSRKLMEGRKEFVLSRQLLRSGTSIGANVREAQNGESKKDFVHKLSIARKEADETIYWLEPIEASGLADTEECAQLSAEAEELLRILRSIILTSKGNTHS
jgi:four helix bundle protein